MSSLNYFDELVDLPTVISAPGRYLTRCGSVVEVTEPSTRNEFGCVGKLPDGSDYAWHRSGRLFVTRESPWDIIEYADGGG